MLVSTAEVRNRIEEIHLSSEGYKRQIRAPGISPERRERLEGEVALMEEEIATLEKIAQLGRVEEDRTKIEAMVLDRLTTLRERLAGDSATSDLKPEEYSYVSGEVKALMWALGEDRLLQSMRQASASRDASQGNPAQFDNAVAATLVRALREGAERDTRASAAYDIGRLHIVSALPQLAAALDDHPHVAAVALRSLSSFSDVELTEVGLPEAVMQKVANSR
jgi:hypothetical protein